MCVLFPAAAPQAYKILQTAEGRKRLRDQMAAPPPSVRAPGGGSGGGGGAGGGGGSFTPGTSVDMPCWSCMGMHAAKIWKEDR